MNPDTSSSTETSYPLARYRTSRHLVVPSRLHQVDGQISMGLRTVPACEGELSVLLADYRAEQGRWWMLWRWSARKARLAALRRVLRGGLLLVAEAGQDLRLSWPEGAEEAVRRSRAEEEGGCRR